MVLGASTIAAAVPLTNIGAIPSGASTTTGGSNIAKATITRSTAGASQSQEIKDFVPRRRCAAIAKLVAKDVGGRQRFHECLDEAAVE
jgi:hypothetical protein